MRQEDCVNIIVPIKQVPESSSVKMDPETGTMVRTGVETVVNPLDLYAIESALRLKETSGGCITVISMGPQQAEKALREALSMGCDKAVLLCDKQFAGSDTWATSYVLHCLIQGMDDFDLIITGERATDGDTGQVGPGIAAWLDIPLVTYAAAIEENIPGKLAVSRMIEEGYQNVEVQLPALVTVVKEIGSVRLPTLKGKKRARQENIQIVTADMLLSSHEPTWGLGHSPTRVVKIDNTTVARTGITIAVNEQLSADEAVDQLVDYLASKNLM